ncbi:MAG TPA: (Fe-S)-binding protein [Hyphomicrobiaceae bacterium]|nr:(Fe-S)-binding protein [Hyphomicrobiaceae bacterium]
MAVNPDRITFWFGCNMLRHAEMIRLSIMLLERVGYDVNTVGGPAYCCGTAHDHQPHAASNMAARTVGRFNDAAETDGRGTVVTWCPSCHIHMSDIMSPGNATAFEIAHITELLADRADRLAPLLSVAVNRRVLLHRHLGFATHVPVNDRVTGLLSRIPGLQLVQGPPQPGHMCSALATVPGGLAKALDETWSTATRENCDTLCTIFHSCHRDVAALEGRDGVRVRNWVHLVAEAMGLEASDAYLGWRTGAAPDVAAIERADESRYKSLIEPELRRPPPL